MKFEPHVYQKAAIKHLEEHRGAALFLEMGMGKSICTLTALDDLKYDMFESVKILVIAPKPVARDTWDAEIEKWNHTKHLTWSKILGTEKQRLQALEKEADIYLINRENVTWLVDLVGKRWPFDTVVIDELSSFKDPSSRRFRSLKKVRALIKRLIGLTGTPAPNGYMDLWAQLYLLDGGKRLGKTIGAYRNHYFVPGRRNGHIVYDWVLREGAAEEIQERIKDICLSLSADDWLQVPEQINITHSVDLGQEILSQYKAFAKSKLMEIEDSEVPIVADSAGVLTNKLLQFANGRIYDEDHHVRYIHDEKLQVLEALIDEANGKPVLVFYAFKHDEKAIRDQLADRNICDLSEEGAVKRWNAGEIEILLVHPASVAYGLNLQDGGNIIIWYGLTYSLEAYLQANARLHRQCQKQKVLIHHLVAKGTVDEDVMRVLDNKNITQKELLESVKARIRNY